MLQNNTNLSTPPANNRQPYLAAGAWRPMYPWEHIAWINPPWENDDFIWLDFPEAIFTDQGLLYLSHINPAFPVRFPDLGPEGWTQTGGALRYERVLPNGIAFEGTLSVQGPQCVSLALRLVNGSSEPLTSIRLQTCLFLRAYYQLAAFTWENKRIHVTGKGWVDLQTAKEQTGEEGRYRFGWRSGPKIADLPVIACSASPDRWVAFTWFHDTYAMISNPKHPCIHADPAIPDLPSGAGYTLRGEIFFAEHGLREIEERYG